MVAMAVRDRQTVERETILRLLTLHTRQVKPDEWRVPSASERGVWHVVTRRGASFFCTCTAGQFSRRCRHVAAVRRAVGLD